MEEQQFLFDPRFLDMFTGKFLLSDPVAALVELIANSWDAGATRVDIDWPSNVGGQVTISDNGSGMEESDFLLRWRTLSYDRVKMQGSYVKVIEMPELPERHVFGRNGVGRFATFFFDSSYCISSCCSGKEFKYLIKRGTSSPFEMEQIHCFDKLGHGTTIEVKHNNTNLLSLNAIISEIGVRFLMDPNFAVYINNRKVGFKDLDDKSMDKHEITIGNNNIMIYVIVSRRTDRTTKQHGIAWHVNGRLVGRCGWKGSGHESLIDGRRIEAKRYTFIIFANCLNDSVNDDWTGFNEDDELYVGISNKVNSFIYDKLIEFSSERKELVTKELKKKYFIHLKKMTPISRDKWSRFVNSIQEECPSLTSKELENLGGILANLELSDFRYKLIHKLHELKPSQLDDLHSILKDWTVDLAKIVLDEVEVRLRLINELVEKTGSRETLELQELQPLFERGLWIFGPEYETIEYTSNESITTIIQKIFNKKEIGSRERPDFVVLPDSTAGFYSYPEYDEESNEVGIAKIVIIELKKPGKRIGIDEKNQCYKYYRKIKDSGMLLENTIVHCFALGSNIDPAEITPRYEQDGRVIIRLMTFHAILERAKNRLLKLYEKVKNAPFLEKEDMEKYLEYEEIEEPILDGV